MGASELPTQPTSLNGDRLKLLNLIQERKQLSKGQQRNRSEESG